MRYWLVGGLVAGVATSGIVMIVQAAIPDPNGVIHACYRPNGNVRLVDKSSCTGNETAISESAKRGFSLFNGKAGCARCHTGWNFTDNRFHDIGTTSTDIGRGALEPDNVLAQYAFKTPTLRDTAQRAPYMHDGSFATLNDVLANYLKGGIDRPSRAKLLKRINLNDQEVADVIEFLKSLTGSKQVVVLPVLPN